MSGVEPEVEAVLSGKVPFRSAHPEVCEAVVLHLHGQGLSIPQIGARLGVNRFSVGKMLRDLAALEERREQRRRRVLAPVVPALRPGERCVTRRTFELQSAA